MGEDVNYEKAGIGDYARWIFEFTDTCCNLEKSLEFAHLFKQRLATFYMDGNENNNPEVKPKREYIEAGRLFWMELFEGNRYHVPPEVVERLSFDMMAPFVVFGRLQSKAFERGYRGGNRDFDDLSNDLASGGVLH